MLIKITIRDVTALVVVGQGSVPTDEWRKARYVARVAHDGRVQIIKGDVGAGEAIGDWIKVTV